ncbi:MAG: GNAT family N-acetyltransferase, partial [Tepidiformaceae bacterium]
AYVGDEPAGWVSVAPRERFPRVRRSPRVRPEPGDNAPAWSIVCFVIAREHRGEGLMRRLIEAACDYAGDHGASAIEAYPKDPDAGPVSNDNAFTGIASTFLALGFEEVVRRHPAQPVMRKTLPR